MRKRVGLYLVLGLVLAVAGLAAAHYKGGSHRKDYASQKACCPEHGKHGGWGSCLVDCGNLPSPCTALKFQADLELTDSQVTKLKALSSASKKEKVRLKADIKILKLELAELLDEKVVDKAAVDAKVDEVALASAKCAKKCIQTKLDTRQLLTDEQLKKLEGLKSTCPLSKGDPEAAVQEGQDGFAASTMKPKCGQKI